MIFDEICKNIEFVVDDFNGEVDWAIDNFYLGKIIEKGKVMFPELMEMYEGDSANATIFFYESQDGGLCAEINFYEDPNGSALADLYLRGDSFTEFLSTYCGGR